MIQNIFRKNLYGLTNVLVHVKFGNVEYHYHEDHHILTIVSVYGKELKGYLCDLLTKSDISTYNSFSRFPYQLTFMPEVRSICMKIFESISLVKECGQEELADCSSLQKFWNKDNLNVANGEPDEVIPQILPMNKVWDGKPVRKEVFPLLIAYNLRNYGGHNIRQQSIFTSKYDEILEMLFVSLFLCVDI